MPAPQGARPGARGRVPAAIGADRRRFLRSAQIPPEKVSQALKSPVW
jgi:hypothetical protein